MIFCGAARACRCGRGSRAALGPPGCVHRLSPVPRLRGVSTGCPPGRVCPPEGSLVRGGAVFPAPRPAPPYPTPRTRQPSAPPSSGSRRGPMRTAGRRWPRSRGPRTETRGTRWLLRASATLSAPPRVPFQRPLVGRPSSKKAKKAKKKKSAYGYVQGPGPGAWSRCSGPGRGPGPGSRGSGPGPGWGPTGPTIDISSIPVAKSTDARSVCSFCSPGHENSLQFVT